MNTITEINKRIQRQDVESLNDKRFFLAVCGKCGWAGVASIASKLVANPKGEIYKRKRYPKSKCPLCNQNLWKKGGENFYDKKSNHLL